MQGMKRLSLLLASAVLLSSCAVGRGDANPSSSASSVSSASSLSSRSREGLRSSSSASSASSVSSVSSSPLPPTPYSFKLSVPFSPQAPFANWDAVHEEACEEMSLILVHHFLTKTDITPNEAETELQAMIAWETEHGYGYDVTVRELGEIAQAYYGHSFRVVENPSTADLKRLLAGGDPVIVPAAGRDLGNPYFSGAGPWYHMLVLTGYNDFFFVTNDVGTKRGKDYTYRFDTFVNAIHDWTGVKEEIRTGAKKVLIVEP